MGTVSKGFKPEELKENPDIFTKFTIQYTFEKKENDGKCCICLDELEIGQDMLKLPCEHSFHHVCGVRSLSMNKICPACMVEVVIN